MNDDSKQDHPGKNKFGCTLFAELRGQDMRALPRILRTFSLNVSAHPYCTRNSLRDVMPRHALSARTVEEMWRCTCIVLVGTLMSMHGFNSLKCSVTPYFLLMDYILCRLSTFCEKLNLCCGSLIFFNFSALASSNSAFIVAARSLQKSILEVEFNLKDDTSSNYLLDRPT